LNHDGNLLRYKSLIQKAVGDEGKVLTDLIDNLHLIIGEQPKLADVVGENSKNRFYYVFCNLIRAICNEDHPFVFFLDDLQWADMDSLKLLCALFSDKSVKFLLFVGAYRDDQLTESHSLSKAILEIKDTEVTMNHIKINDLSSKDVNDLISDVLHLSKMDTISLTTLIYEKTKGNAFFVDQFLRSLHSKNLLYFSREEHKWKWDTGRFDSNMISSNVSELVLGNVLNLDEAMKNVLMVASCVGSPFLLSMLTLITGETDSVERVVSQGIILPIDARKTWHRFAHDHIQEAIFALIPENDREARHYKIGKLLWEKCVKEGRDENIFVTVNLLNSGINMIKDQERHGIARLNLHAGLKAMSSIAFKAALDYINNGIKCLKEDSWRNDYELTLKLHNSAAEAALCAKNSNYLHKVMHQVFQNATAFEHKVECYSIQMRECNISRNYKETLKIGLFVLEQLGVNIPSEPTESFAMQEVQKALAMIKNEAVDQSILHEDNNNSNKSTMQILLDLTLSCYFFWPTGVPILTSRMIQYSLTNGVSKFSGVAFALFAMTASCKLDDYKEGYQIAQMSLSLLQKFQAKELSTNAYAVIYGNIAHWCESIHKSMGPLMQNYHVGFEVGQIGLSAISGNTYCQYSLFIGRSLGILEAEIKELNERIPLKSLAIKSTYQAVLNLCAKSEDDPGYLFGEVFDYRKCTKEKENISDYARSLINCLVIAYFFHKHEMASKWADTCRPLSKSLFGCYFYPIYTFYDGLVAVTLAKTEKEDYKWKNIVNESMTKLKKWSENSENYRNKLCLLEAEMSALDHDNCKAFKLFDDAIALSKKNKFLNEEALAYERAGIFHLGMKCTEKASHLLSQSYDKYLEWGAIAKANQLKGLHPDLIITRNILETASCAPQASIVEESFSISEMSGISFMSEPICSQKKKKARFL